MAQINAAVNHPWITIFKISTGGNDMGVGYYIGPDTEYGIYGIPPPVARVNSRTVHDDILRKRIATSEISELAGNFDDLNPGESYSYLTDSSGKLTLHGIQLLNYLGIKDAQKIGVTNTASSSTAALQSVGNINARIGNVNLGFSGSRLSAGFKRNNIGVSTEVDLAARGLRANTSASFTGKGFSTSLIASLSPVENYFASEVNANIGKENNTVNVGVRGSYATNSRDNSVGVSIKKDKFSVLLDRNNRGSNVTDSAALQASFDVGEKNSISLSGGMVNSRGLANASSLTLNANACLDGLLRGLNINAGLGRDSYGMIDSRHSYLGIVQKIGPGLLCATLSGIDGKMTDYRIAFSLSADFR